MKQNFFRAAAAAAVLFLFAVSVQAYEIQKGTISIGGASNIFYKSRNFDKSGTSKTYSLFLDGGYFIRNNLELGAELLLESYDAGDYESRSYSLSPFIMYHIPLDEQSNIIAGGGLGYSKYETDEDNTTYESRGATMFGEVGWEYFFNPHVAMNISFNLRHIEWKLDNYSVDKDGETSILTKLGLKAFF